MPRQFYSNGVYYHSKRERLPSWDELFLDLVYVAIIYNCGEILKAAPITMDSLQHFILVTVMCLNTWYAQNYVSNSFSSSDMTYRIFLWVYHILALLMSVYGPGVMITKEEAYSSHVAFPGTANAFISFYFASQAWLMIGGLSVFTTFPKVAWNYMIQTGFILLAAIPAMVSIAYPQHIIPLWWTSIALYYVFLPSFYVIDRLIFRNFYVILTDLEHFIERYNIFTIVVMGEMFTAIVFHSTDATQVEPAVSVVLGIIIALSIQFIYYNVDQENVFLIF